jgi:hypothetical protein
VKPGRPIACLVALTVLVGCSATVDGVAYPEPATAVPPAPVPTATATATAAPAPAQPDDRFTDAGNRFRIAPPPGWSTDTSGVSGTAVVFRDPAAARAGDRAFSPNINVLVAPPRAELAVTLAAARQELRTLPGYTSTADEAAVLADGTPAHLLGGTFTDARSGTQLRNLQIYAVRGTSSVVATGTAPAPSWASSAGAIDAALRTLTVAP